MGPKVVVSLVSKILFWERGCRKIYQNNVMYIVNEFEPTLEAHVKEGSNRGCSNPFFKSKLHFEMGNFKTW